jgi:outer membrane protein TolC
LQAATTGAGSRNLFSGDNLVYSAGPRISWPFFNYGRIENNVRVEDARLQQLLIGYRETVLRAAQEVEDALTGFLNSQESLVFEQGAVQAATRSQELAMVQYREGAADYERVLDAQRSLLGQQNSMVQARSAVTTNLIALYKALGGGWELSQGHDFVSESTQKEMKERTNWSDLLNEPSSPETKKNPPPAKR